MQLNPSLRCHNKPNQHYNPHKQVLVATLVGDARLDVESLHESVHAVGLGAKAAAVARFETWTAGHPLTGKVAAMRRASADPDSVRVRDTEHLVAAVRFFSIRHYVTVG